MATVVQRLARTDSVSSPGKPGKSLGLICPACPGQLGEIDPLEVLTPQKCPSCGFVMEDREGIWSALAPAGEQKFRQFTAEYQGVRLQEGRGSAASDYYLALPFRDLTGRNVWQWNIRGRSYTFLARRILPQLEQQKSRGLDILDLGAGNGWLSYRLALRGHSPVAVDLLVNDLDGLGAARHYFASLPRRFPRFRAEMDRLPFAGGQFDLVVFNASFHYSEDYGRTVAETLRCLRRPGNILIVDSPFYQREESGRQMVEARHAEFQKQYGFRSDSVRSREYVTAPVLGELARQFGIAWIIARPWYGLGWALRPVRAWLRRRREPAKFRIFWGRVQ